MHDHILVIKKVDRTKLVHRSSNLCGSICTILAKLIFQCLYVIIFNNQPLKFYVRPSVRPLIRRSTFLLIKSASIKLLRMYPINSIFSVDVLLNKYYNMRKLKSFGKNSVELACDCP